MNNFYYKTIRDKITLKDFFIYSLIYIIPMLLVWIGSRYLSVIISKWLNASPSVVFEILTIPFIYFLFFYDIDYIRKRNSVSSVRIALAEYILINVLFSLPALIKGDFSVMFLAIMYIAGFLLITFLVFPEVLGLPRDVYLWFRMRKHLSFILIYLLIIIFYASGFGWMYYDMYNYDSSTFIISNENIDTDYINFFYFSIVAFSTTGFGDIIPVHPLAIGITTSELLIGMIMNVVFVSMIFVFISSKATNKN